MELCKSLLRRVDSFKNCPLVGRGGKEVGGCMEVSVGSYAMFASPNPL